MPRLRNLYFIITLTLLSLVGGTAVWSATAPAVIAAPEREPTAPLASITLKPVADASIVSAKPAENFGAADELAVASQSLTAVTQTDLLIQFDLAAIPAGSIIERATLTFEQQTANGEEKWQLPIRRVSQSWSEKTVTYRTQPPTETTRLSMISPEEDGITVRADVTDLVRQWHYAPLRYRNHGLQISGNSPSASRVFDSREGRNPPLLAVEYTPPPATITIPHATEQGKLDGFCDTDNEYRNALRYQYIDHNETASNLYLKQDDDFFYACIEGVQGSFNQRFFSLNLDRDHGRDKYAGPEDYSLRVRPVDSFQRSYMGTGSSVDTWEETTLTNWQAVAQSADTAALPDVAEYQIPLSELSTTCGQPFGLGIYHQWVTDNGVDYGWPTQNSHFSPTTWIEATLARPTCPIRVCLESATDCRVALSARVYTDSSDKIYRVNRAGYLLDRAEIADGTALWATVPISVTERYSLYYTSGTPAVVSPAAYREDPLGQMTIVISDGHPLMLHNLDLTAQWNLEGDPAYKAQLRDNILAASAQFYDFTNAQMALGTVTVRQNYESWDKADVWLFANNNLRPEADIGGTVETLTVDPFWDGTGDKHKLVYEPGRAYMGATWNRFGLPGTPISGTGGISGTVDTSGDWAAVLAHELGHYLLYLDDTYFRFRNDFVIENVYSCTGSAMGWVYFEENSEFVFDDGHWAANCLHTSHNDQLQRDEWATMQLWYPWLAAPSADAGPTALPADLTKVNFVAPSGAPLPVVNQLFDLDYRDGEAASAEARAVIFRNNRVIDQGKPSKGSTQIQLHGAQAGDRLCLIDINDNALNPETPRNQYGCETISVGDNTLFLEKDSGWAPVMLIDPVTPTIPGGTTLAISVTQPLTSSASLKARIYPEHQEQMTEVALTSNNGSHSTTVDLPFTPAAYVQLWVDEPEAPDGSDPRREAIVDFGVGGGGLPGPASQFGWAPIISSSDGRAFFVARSGLTLQAGEFIALQSMAGTPPLPVNTTIVDQPYRLIAYPASLVDGGSINLRFNLALPLQAASTGTEPSHALHFWNGTSWQPLATTFTTEPNGNQLASAASQGVGIYALLATTEQSHTTYIPIVQR